MPALFGWHLDQNNLSFLTFFIVTHLATAIVLFVFFLKDWIQIFKGLGRSVRDRRISADDTYAKLGGCSSPEPSLPGYWDWSWKSPSGACSRPRCLLQGFWW